MPRIRSIHPGFWTDEAIVSVSRDARLFFIGLWGQADDKGAFEWKPTALKMRIYPADDVDIGALLGELTAADMVRSYLSDGRRYGAIRNFRRYQRPKKPNDLYPMPDSIRVFSEGFRTGSEPVGKTSRRGRRKEGVPPRVRSPQSSSPPKGNGFHPSRNPFADIAADMVEETANAEQQTDPRPGSARVVRLARHPRGD